MNSDSARLDDLLQKWEDEGTSPAELCCDRPDLLPELERRVQGLKAMDWMNEKPSISGYRFMAKLGQGGFGQVWKASQAGKLVAVKIIESAEKSSEKRLLDRLKGLHHPNVLAVLDAWEKDKSLVVVMELADRSLADGPIPREKVAQFIRQAAAGIDYLHENDLTHRDIKPSNLLLVNGVLKVADFGLAKSLSHSATGHTGVLTLSYAAPEFFDGKTTKAGDQYSLAVTYCQLRGGRLPFQATNPAQLVAAHLSGRPDLTMLQERERPIVARALAKKPEDRWPTCSAFVDALTGRFADDTELLPQERRRRPSRWVQIAVGVVLFLLLVGVLALTLRPRTGGASGSSSDVEIASSSRGQPESAIDLDTLPAFVFDGKSRIITPVERFAPVTLECWVRPEKSSGGPPWKCLIGSDIAGHSGISVRFVFVNGHEKTPVLNAQLLPAPVAREMGTSTPLPLNTWSHVAAVFTENETAIYLNGKEVAQGPKTASEGGTVFVVGNAGRENKDLFIAGRIWAVRISKGARYTGEFKPDKEFAPDDSAVVIYSASHVEGKRALDLSGRGNDGVLDGVEVAKPTRSSSSSAGGSSSPFGMSFVKVPAGSFWMSKDHKNAQRQETIKADFYLGKFMVTQEQWQDIMETNPSVFTRGNEYVKDVSDADLRQFPVENVSWNDVQEFLKKLNEREKDSGWKYRLPTEAEWEYACRGGATSKDECSFDFYFEQPSNHLDFTQATFGAKRPSKVGSHQPNRLGLYDMHGNPWEWCDDLCDGSRVVRGGGWDGEASYCRAASLRRYPPDTHLHIIGFRVARVPVEK